MQPAHILLQCTLPGDWHREEQRIQASVVKAFPDVASRRQNHPRFVFGDCSQGCCCFPTLLFSHAALQDENVLGNAPELGREMMEMLCAASQKEWATPGLYGTDDVVDDHLVA